MRQILFVILIVFANDLFSNEITRLFLDFDQNTTYSDLKKRFEKTTMNNPLLKLRPGHLWAAVSFTRGYCDRSARFDAWRCWLKIKYRTRKDNRFGVDDYRDPRVYRRLHSWLLEHKLKSPREFAINNQSYGFKH